MIAWRDADILPLVDAVIKQAAAQAKAGDRAAALWLATDGECWLNMMGWDRAAAEIGLLARGCLAQIDAARRANPGRTPTARADRAAMLERMPA